MEIIAQSAALCEYYNIDCHSGGSLPLTGSPTAMIALFGALILVAGLLSRRATKKNKESN